MVLHDSMRNKSGVFISYARSDGSDYATWLRSKLQKEHTDIPLWQDIISERPGRDWWLQITDALDHVAYMVIVAPRLTCCFPKGRVASFLLETKMAVLLKKKRMSCRARWH